ncbi:hypothetical protein D3C75_760460 [compost metagenome]
MHAAYPFADITLQGCCCFQPADQRLRAIGIIIDIVGDVEQTDQGGKQRCQSRNKEGKAVAVSEQAGSSQGQIAQKQHRSSENRSFSVIEIQENQHQHKHEYVQEVSQNQNHKRIYLFRGEANHRQ